ncbi:hypothetical protein CASFOL_011432 [Castilleja foliolosa]|uniref:Phosphoglycerate mutase n=1 Tax=Castilleja foliolosa TaxID=1961234 RepID=A0ABD3DXA2_9LAMI
MADSKSRVSELAQFDNGGDDIESVGPKYAEIIVIRHGKTEWNDHHRIQGQLDVDLNDVGRQQAFAVAERLSREEPKISAVYSSDLIRASDTAEVIARSCGVLEVIKDRDLRERHLGDLQGVLFHEAAQINPQAHKAFVASLSDLEIPGGGESFFQLYDRCTLALQRIAKKHRGDRVVVVSHGATIEALLTRANPSEDFRGKILNACVNVFHLSEDHLEKYWSIQSWGDVSHLKTRAS